jgi:hypothetical protein
MVRQQMIHIKVFSSSIRALGMLVLLPLSVVLFLTRADSSLFHCQYLQLAIVRDKRQQRAGERLDSSCLPGGSTNGRVEKQRRMKDCSLLIRQDGLLFPYIRYGWIRRAAHTIGCI